MKPIEYKLVDKPKYIKNEKEVIDTNEWDDGKMIAYNPEWLTEATGKSYLNQKLEANNLMLVEYMNNKEKYTYIATWKKKQFKIEHIVEYYYLNQDKIIAFYSEKIGDYSKRMLMSCFIWRRKQAIQ